LPERIQFQVNLETSSGSLAIPRQPVNIPSGVYTVWPVNLDLGPAVLRYSTAQPLIHLRGSNTFVFFAWSGVATEFAIEEKPGISIDAPHAHVDRERGVAYVSGIEPATAPAIQIRGQGVETTQILVLTREQALNAWKASLGGKERLILSHADIYFDSQTMHLRADDPSLLKASIFPAWDKAPAGLKDLGSDGVFRSYEAPPRPAPVQLTASVEEQARADDPPPVRISRDVPLIPDESAFEKAARWKIRVPNLRPQSDVFLNIRYEGDIARLYAGGKLFTDNFYNGTVWQVGLRRIPAQELERGLELKILPLREDSPIYLPDGARPKSFKDGEAAKLDSVQVIPEYEVTVDFSHER